MIYYDNVRHKNRLIIRQATIVDYIIAMLNIFVVFKSTQISYFHLDKASIWVHILIYDKWYYVIFFSKYHKYEKDVL